MRKAIWAPWRMEFITNVPRGRAKGCLFCRLPEKGESAKNLVLFADKTAFVVLNRYPYTNGHLLVVPRRHFSQFSRMKPDEHLVVARLINRSIAALKKAYRAQGFNIGLNLGAVAGAGIRGHLHYHVVPRWKGDSNFMPVLGEVRMMPEHIRKTHQRLVLYFRD